MYYFAYGSNMNVVKLKKYLCNAKFNIIGSGYLNDYIFTYRNFTTRKLSAKANIEPRKNSTVYGLIIEIDYNINNCKKLDKKEGVQQGLYYKHYNLTITHCDSNKQYNCFSYIMNYDNINDYGNPSKSYRDTILSSAYKLNIPTLYIKNRILKIH